MQAAVEIADALAQVANPADASPMAAYMQQIAPFLGVRAVARRAVVRQWCRQHPMASQSDVDRKSTRLNSSHIQKSRMPSSA